LLESPEIADQDGDADEERPGKDRAGGTELGDAEAVEVEAGDPHGGHGKNEGEIAERSMAREVAQFPAPLHEVEAIDGVGQEAHAEEKDPDGVSGTRGGNAECGAGGSELGAHGNAEIGKAGENTG